MLYLSLCRQDPRIWRVQAGASEWMRNDKRYGSATVTLAGRTSIEYPVRLDGHILSDKRMPARDVSLPRRSLGPGYLCFSPSRQPSLPISRYLFH